LGIEPRPNGTLAEQFLHAEATNLQIGAGMALAHRFAPGINALERGLDLTLRIRNVGAAGSPRPQLGSRTGEETSPLQMRNGLQPLFATMTSRGPDRSSPFILAMSSLRDDGGEASPAPPRIFNALPKRGKNGADAFHLNPIPRQRWEKPNQVNVNELGVSEGGTLLTRGLTSCSALLLYDADRGAGAMIHLQPPVISRELKTSEEVHRFVDLAIQRALDVLGGEVKNVRAMTIRSGISPLEPPDPARDPQVAGYLWSDAISLSLKARGILTRDLPLHQGIAEIGFDTTSGDVRIDPFPATHGDPFDLFPTHPLFSPVHESVPIDARRYSVLDGQKTGPSIELAVRPQGDDLFGFEGFGFLIFQGARGRLRNSGLIYCSRLAIFDPTTGIAVDSHLPVYFDDFDAFKPDLKRSLERLRRRGMNLEHSRITLIYGRVVRTEHQSLGWYPGEKITEMLNDLGVSVNTAFAADRNYDFNLETGEILPAPEEE